MSFWFGFLCGTATTIGFYALARWFLLYKLPSMMLDGARRQDPLPPPEDKP